MLSMSLTVLGSSAGKPQPNRANAGYLFSFGDDLILFDCGGGVSSSFLRSGFDPSRVRGIVISHTHPDHISDLPLFIQMIHLTGREREERYSADIYVPGEAQSAVQSYLNSVYLHREKLFLDYSLLAVPEDGTIGVGDVSIVPIRNGHLKGNADIIAEYGWKNKMQCYSYLIKLGHKSILYSADLGSEADIFPYLDDLDLLVVESTHIDIENLMRETVERDVKRLILSHFEAGYDIDRAAGIAQKLGVDNFSAASDGLRVGLK